MEEVKRKSWVQRRGMRFFSIHSGRNLYDQQGDLWIFVACSAYWMAPKWLWGKWWWIRSVLGGSTWTPGSISIYWSNHIPQLGHNISYGDYLHNVDFDVVYDSHSHFCQNIRKNVMILTDSGGSLKNQLMTTIAMNSFSISSILRSGPSQHGWPKQSRRAGQTCDCQSTPGCLHMIHMMRVSKLTRPSDVIRFSLDTLTGMSENRGQPPNPIRFSKDILEPR